MRRRRRRRQRGVAITEFVIVLVPFWLLISMVMQLGLASLARVTVEYAARVAVRAAVVEAPRAKSPQGGDVQTAAAYPLIALSPPVDRAKISIGEHLGDGAPAAELEVRASYARRATAVEVTPASPAWNDPVTAEVFYLYACQIPFANSIVCHRFADLPSDVRGRFDGSYAGWYLVLRAKHTLTNQGRPGR